jgi:ABC-type transport system involved in Fe-S cluster assembly fused permease/ATPase subunit
MAVVEDVVLLVVEFDVWFVYVDVVVVWVGEALTVKVLEAESPASMPDAVIV